MKTSTAFAIVTALAGTVGSIATARSECKARNPITVQVHDGTTDRTATIPAGDVEVDVCWRPDLEVRCRVRVKRGWLVESDETKYSGDENQYSDDETKYSDDEGGLQYSGQSGGVAPAPDLEAVVKSTELKGCPEVIAVGPHQKNASNAWRNSAPPPWPMEWMYRGEEQPGALTWLDADLDDNGRYQCVACNRADLRASCKDLASEPKAPGGGRIRGTCQVQYLRTRAEQAMNQLYVDATGRLRWLKDGVLFDTTLATGTRGHGIYVMSMAGDLYVSLNPKQGMVHHSTLLGGAPVIAAGMIGAKAGVLRYVDNDSGHYKTHPCAMDLVKRVLKTRGLRAEIFPKLKVGNCESDKDKAAYWAGKVFNSGNSGTPWWAELGDGWWVSGFWPSPARDNN